jgi:hypothetical protein
LSIVILDYFGRFPVSHWVRAVSWAGAIIVSIAIFYFALPTVDTLSIPSTAHCCQVPQIKSHLTDSAAPVPTEALVKVMPTCMYGGPFDELCKPVWRKIEADNGEVTWVDVYSISGGWVTTYTGVPNDGINVNSLEKIFFDCRGHYEVWGDEGPSPMMDAPPRSIAGLTASIVCRK